MDMLAPVPEAKAAAAAPPSSALIPCSSAWRFGLSLRVYINPREYVPAASRSNVVERWIGNETAPVAGSTEWPAWTAKVSILIVLISRRDATGCKCGCRTYGVAASGLTHERFRG